MPRQAQTTTGVPFAKLVTLGDTLIAAWGGAARRQAFDFKKRTPKVKDDGTAKLEEINWFVAMPGTTAKVGSDGSYEAIEPGAVVRLAFDGWKWHQVIDARKALPAMSEFGIAAGREAWGDVYTITFRSRSVSTDNPDAARRAGFTVVENRIVMATVDEHKAWIDAQVARGNTDNLNTGKDLAIAVRRVELPNEAKWDELANDLADTKPWEHTVAPAGSDESDDSTATSQAPIEEEPF